MSISTEQVKAAFPTVGTPFKIGGGWAHVETAYGIYEGDTVNASVVGAASSIDRLLANDGYFADQYQDEIIRGHVYIHDGVYYAVADSSENGCMWLRPTTADDAVEAAQIADGMADTIAASARAYNEAWGAGSDARSFFDGAREQMNKAQICKAKGVPCSVWRDFVTQAKAYQQQALNLVRESAGWTDDYREVFREAMGS